jgi:hypothetical protein
MSVLVYISYVNKMFTKNDLCFIFTLSGCFMILFEGTQFLSGIILLEFLQTIIDFYLLALHIFLGSQMKIILHHEN